MAIVKVEATKLLYTGVFFLKEGFTVPKCKPVPSFPARTAISPLAANKGPYNNKIHFIC